MDDATAHRLTIDDLDDAAGLRLSGELDSHTSSDLEAHLEHLVGGADPEIVLDLANVEFLDSAGLRVVIAQHQRLADAGRRLVLANPSAPVVRLLEITGLEGHLHVA